MNPPPAEPGNAPEGFAAWALSQGAVDLESDDEWDAIQKQAATQP